MSDTFNFKRFWTFFCYDLRQMWRRSGMQTLLIGSGGLIFSVFWVFFGLVTMFKFSTPSVSFRVGMFFLCIFLLQLYTTRTYGFITDRKKGQDYLMIPASTLEKFISMIIITLIVIPLAFTVTFMLTDALVYLANPGDNSTLFNSLIDNTSIVVNHYNGSNVDANLLKVLPLSRIIRLIALSHCYNLLYNLLCGLTFKRLKILASILIGMGICVVLFGILTSIGKSLMQNPESEYDVLLIINTVTTFVEIYLCTAIVGFAAGAYYRLKKIQL